MYRQANEDTAYTQAEPVTGGTSLATLELRHVTESKPADWDPRGDAKPAWRRLRRLPRFDRRTLLASAVVLVIGAGGAVAADWWWNSRYIVSTDDAYVRAHNTTLASKISGYVASIPVEDNTPIHAGDVIATIDDGDYRLAADAAP